MKNSKSLEYFKKTCCYFSFISWISFFMFLSFKSGVDYQKKEDYEDIQEVVKKTKEIIKNKDIEIKSMEIICRQNEIFSIEKIENLEEDLLSLYFLIMMLKELEKERDENFHCLPKEFL